MTELAKTISDWAVPFLLASIPLYAFVKGVKVYECFTEGAQEGFAVAIRILPYMVAILVAMGVFRASGALEYVTTAISPVTKLLGVPPEVVPIGLIRPLSGSGALGLMVEIFDTWGPDSFVGKMASTIQGSTDTTFYILTVYFGSVGITRPRHAVLAGLFGDLCGFLGAVFISNLLFS